VERRGFSPPGSCDERVARLRASRETLGGLKARRSTSNERKMLATDEKSLATEEKYPASEEKYLANEEKSLIRQSSTWQIGRLPPDSQVPAISAGESHRGKIKAKREGINAKGDEPN
jgi:hypothetical protein